MIKFPKTICISLQEDTKRREFITNQAKKIGIDILFLDAVNGHKINLHTNPQPQKED